MYRCRCIWDTTHPETASHALGLCPNKRRLNVTETGLFYTRLSPSDGAVVERQKNETPRSKMRGITELNSEDFSAAEVNPIASNGESSSSTLDRPGAMWSRLTVRLGHNPGGHDHAQEARHPGRDHLTSAWHPAARSACWPPDTKTGPSPQHAPIRMWGTDATSIVTLENSVVTVLIGVDHCTLEGIGIHI